MTYNYISLDEKTYRFPTLNYISVYDDPYRRNVLHESIKNNFTNIKVRPNIFNRFTDGEINDLVIFPNYDWFLEPNHPKVYRDEYLGIMGAFTSHLKAIKNWYFETDEEYAIFCEDDLYLETIKYWNFTWEDFFSNLPEDWDCVQLQITRFNIYPDYANASRICYPKVKLRERDICNWGCCAYLINRDRAKKMIDTYYPGDKIIFEYKGVDFQERFDYFGIDNLWAFYPTIENVIYTNFKFGKVYSIPLLTENCSLKTTVRTSNGAPNLHSYFTVMSWWRDVGKKISINDII